MELRSYRWSGCKSNLNKGGIRMNEFYLKFVKAEPEKLNNMSFFTTSNHNMQHDLRHCILADVWRAVSTDWNFGKTLNKHCRIDKIDRYD